jgi:hypothetical protein
VEVSTCISGDGLCFLSAADSWPIRGCIRHQSPRCDKTLDLARAEHHVCNQMLQELQGVVVILVVNSNVGQMV